jgi:hypothetical protein
MTIVRKLLAVGAPAAIAGAPFYGDTALAGPPPPSHLHTGEFCAKKYQAYYTPHGFICQAQSQREF